MSPQLPAIGRNRVVGYSEIEEEALRRNRVTSHSGIKQEMEESANGDLSDVSFSIQEYSIVTNKRRKVQDTKPTSD